MSTDQARPTGDQSGSRAHVQGATAPDLDAIEARAAAATPGPWEADGREVSQHWSRPEPWQTVVGTEVSCMAYCYGGTARGVEREADAEFIAHAREDVPALVAEVRRLAAALAEAEAVIEHGNAALRESGLTVNGMSFVYPLGDAIRALAANAAEAEARGAQELPPQGEWITAVGAERRRQREQGYTDEHDREQGADYLLDLAIEYGRRGEAVKAAALVQAARQVVAHALAEAEERGARQFAAWASSRLGEHQTIREGDVKEWLLGAATEYGYRARAEETGDGA